MRFVLINQYYPPDVAPTGRALQDLASHLVGHGHSVTVVCSNSSYGGAESHVHVDAGIEIDRLTCFPLGRRHPVQKLLHYASFYVMLAIRLLFIRPKPDAIVALTTPPYLGLLACVAAKLRRCRSIDWVMDLYPDVMQAHGMLEKSSLLYRGLVAANNLYLKRSALVITLGPDMAERAKVYQGEAPGLCVPLWAPCVKYKVDSQAVARHREGHGWGADETVFLYSGNMGLGHLLEEWLKMIEERGNSDYRVRWVFAGRGARQTMVDQFVRDHPDLPIEMGDYVDESQLPVHLAAGDVHLVSLNPTWDGCMVPSKFQGSFAAGRPVLLLGSKSSNLAQWVLESGGGWVAEAGNPRELHAAVEAALDPGERSVRGERALAFAQERFDLDTNCGMIESEIMKVLS